MMGKAASIPHGHASLSYNNGESERKEHPEKIFFVKNYNIDSALDAEGVKDAIMRSCAHRPRIKRQFIRIVLSPEKENTKNFSQEDWQKLMDDYVAAFDSLTLRDERTGKTVSPPTNLAGSIGTSWLHLESVGEIPHVHAIFSRCDSDGGMNDSHNIHIRGKLAADIVCRQRGWRTAENVGVIRRQEATAACYDALRAMNDWSWTLYTAQLMKRGYSLKTRPDSKGKIVGYSLKRGHTVYNASELMSRSLSAQHIEGTWQRLHLQVEKERQEAEIKKARDYTVRRPDSVGFDVQVGDKEQRVFIPKEAADHFLGEFDWSQCSNHAELLNLSVAVFAQLFVQPEVAHSSGGGGGSTSQLPWRDRDEDDLAYARRCSQYARAVLGVKPRHRFKR